MHMCICLCVHGWIHTHVYTCAGGPVCAWMGAYMRVCIRVQLPRCGWVVVRVYECMCSCPKVCGYMCMCIHVQLAAARYVCSHIHMCICVHIHWDVLRQFCASWADNLQCYQLIIATLSTCMEVLIYAQTGSCTVVPIATTPWRY